MLHVLVKLDLLGQRYTFIFCCLLDETRKSPGDGEILLGNAIRSRFSSATLELQFF